MTTREKANLIKQLQDEALRNLSPNTLYIVLYLRSDPPEPNNFHWGFFTWVIVLYVVLVFFTLFVRESD